MDGYAILTAPWVRINQLHRVGRWVVKTVVFAVVVGAVCFPYPGLAWRHVSHWRHPQAMIDADAPAVGRWVAQLDARLGGHPHTPIEALDAAAVRRRLVAVQTMVRERIAYAFDWQVWGNVDYLPTVREVIRSGREDCDGQAVLAASMLKRMGFDARLVANSSHVWVWTPQGKIMGPQAVQAVQTTPGGLRFNWRGLVEVPRTLAFGIAVFPLVRELFLTLVLWWLWLRPGCSVARAAACAVLWIAALMALRWGGYPIRYGWMATGLVLCVAAVMMSIRAPRPGAGVALSQAQDERSTP